MYLETINYRHLEEDCHEKKYCIHCFNGGCGRTFVLLVNPVEYAALASFWLGRYRV